jgi:hypothetical protein
MLTKNLFRKIEIKHTIAVKIIGQIYLFFTLKTSARILDAKKIGSDKEKTPPKSSRNIAK